MPLNAERIISNALKVAVLPAVAMKFSEAVKDPLTSNKDLENIVAEDPALAAKLLMIANSALFNFPSKIDTISMAVTVIGQKQLNDLILSCSIVAMFKGIPQKIIDMDLFWKHSIAVATSARLFASARHENNIEKFFTAGLLHDIGKLIIFVESPKSASDVIQQCAEKDELMFIVEKELLSFDHAMLGSMLLEKWNLPSDIISAVNYHHNPTLNSGDIIPASIVHVADILAHALQLGSSGEIFVPKLNEKAWDALGLNVDMLGMTIEQLNIQHSEAVKYILG